MIRFLGALQFLTILPIRRSTCAPGESAAYFPLIGAVVGLAGAGLQLWIGNALLTVLLMIFLTGALHEDGLADCADAFGGGGSPDKVLAILKDSRIGAFGALALIFSVGLRAQAISQLSSHVLESMAAAGALSRGAQVALAWISRPAGEGSGKLFALTLSSRRAVTAIVLATAIVSPLGIIALPAVIGSAGLAMLARDYFEHRLGGVNGDCCGALSQVIELAVLTLCAFIW